MPTYFVTCVFSLKNASVENFRLAYAELAGLGLIKAVESEQGVRILIPSTMTIGQFPGLSGDVVRSELRDRITDAFNARGLAADVFIAAGTDWAWGSMQTDGQTRRADDAEVAKLST